jgi:hypothetical protein
MEHTFDSYLAFRAEPPAITHAHRTDTLYQGVLKALNGDAGHRLEAVDGIVWLVIGTTYADPLPAALGQLVSQVL